MARVQNNEDLKKKLINDLKKNNLEESSKIFGFSNELR